MKNIALLLIVFLTYKTAKSEIWIDLGLKAGYAPGVLINPYIFQNQSQMIQFNHGYLYGGKVGLNFGLQHSLSIDLLYSHIQQGLHNNIINTDQTISFNTLDLPILYRSNQENGGYAEIGPQFSFTRSSINSKMGDVTNRFNATNWGLAVGFGQYIAGGDLFGLTFGFRMAYTFADLIAPKYKDNTNNPVYQPYTADEAAKNTYKPTGRLYFGVVLEFNFNLGYFTQGSRCSKRTRFKMF